MNLFNRNSKQSGRKDPRELLRHVETALQVVFVNTLAVREVIRRKEADILRRVPDNILPGAPMLWDAGVESAVNNAKGEMDKFTNHHNNLAESKAVLSLLEQSEVFQRAKSVITPILEAIASYDAENDSRRAHHARTKAELNLLQEKAHAKAMAAIDADPVIVQAKAELAKAEAAL